MKMIVGSKRSLRVKFKDSICTELCRKLWFEKDWLFCDITRLGWFFKVTIQKQSSKQLLPKIKLKK